jgi:uncharacterized protein (TIGR02757 family)
VLKPYTACERTEISQNVSETPRNRAAVPVPLRRVAAVGLRDRLDSLYHGYNAAASLTDPIELVRPYKSGPDREVAGFIAAGLAFGNVTAVMASVRAVLSRMSPSPAAFVRRFDPDRHGSLFDGLVHRWTRDRDIVALLHVLRQMIDRSGSIEGFFAEGDDPGAPDVAAALESFSRRALALDLAAVYGSTRPRPGVAYFFARPSSGGACKRLNLYLRWMVRRDEVDLGVWTRLTPARLVVPLDTHIIRLGQCLQLTRYRSPGWRMAADITAALRTLDPADPVRFDFSICHVGMMGNCGFEMKQGDSQCPLRGVCRPRARRQRTRDEGRGTPRPQTRA